MNEPPHKATENMTMLQYQGKTNPQTVHSVRGTLLYLGCISEWKSQPAPTQLASRGRHEGGPSTFSLGQATADVPDFPLALLFHCQPLAQYGNMAVKEPSLPDTPTASVCALVFSADTTHLPPGLPPLPAVGLPGFISFLKSFRQPQVPSTSSGVPHSF